MSDMEVDAPRTAPETDAATTAAMSERGSQPSSTSPDPEGATVTPPSADDSGGDRPVGLRAQILEEIVACADRVALNATWSFLPQVAGALRLCMPSDELLSLLTKEFDATALVEAGVVEAVGEELRLCPALATEGAIFSVVCDSGHRPARLVGANGRLFVSSPSVLDCAAERDESGANSVPEDLLICGSVEDVDVLAALGLRSIAYYGLESLTCDDAQRIFVGDARTDDAWRYRLVLVDWPIADLVNQRQPGIQQVITRLTEVQQVYGIEPHRRFVVWQPTAAEVQRIDAAVSFRDPSQICLALQQSWQARRDTTDWRAYLHCRPLTLIEAKRKLEEALEHAGAFPNLFELEQARDQYLRAARRSVVAPFETQVEATNDPFEKIALVAMAESARDYFQINKALLDRSPPQAGPLDPYYMQDRLRRRNELLQCRRLMRK